MEQLKGSSAAPWITSPRFSGEFEGTGGRFGPELEDFKVEEIPAYEPSGLGEHTWVLLEKQGWSTPAALRAIARASGAKERDIGVAGLKDKAAVTRQWVSLPPGISDPDEWQLAEGLRIVKATHHKNKLRRGHLHGNRFHIRLVDVISPSAAAEIAAELTSSGTWNVYGPQRFGEDGDNVAKALAWLRGEVHDKRRQRFYRAFYPSVLQSAVFNAWTALRAARGMSEPLTGEVVRLAGTGSHFRVESPEAELGRWQDRDILSTGPMVGPKGLQATDDALELEREAIQLLGLTGGDVAALADLAPGTRRDLLLTPSGLSYRADGSCLHLSFELPAGSYATTIVREFTQGAWLDSRGDDQ